MTYNLPLSGSHVTNANLVLQAQVIAVVKFTYK